MIELITAHRGRGHVTSEDEAARMRGIMGISANSGYRTIAFNSGNKLEITVKDNLNVKVDSGEGLLNGRYFRLTEPVEFTLDEFEKANTYRRDTIIAEILENVETGEEHAEFEVLIGGEHSSPYECSANEFPTEAKNENDKVIECIRVYDIVHSSSSIYQEYPLIEVFDGAYTKLKDLSRIVSNNASGISSLKKSFQDGCKKIAQACNNKGIPTAYDASPDTIVTNIGKVYDKGKADGIVKWKAENLTITTDTSVSLPAERATSCTITMIEYNGASATILCPGPVGSLGNIGESVTFNPRQKGGKVVTIVRTGAQKPIKCSYSMIYE